MWLLYGFWPLIASMEVKNNHAHVTTQRNLNKLIEVNLSVGSMVWPSCCQFQDSITMSLINMILHTLEFCNFCPIVIIMTVCSALMPTKSKIDLYRKAAQNQPKSHILFHKDAQLLYNDIGPFLKMLKDGDC